MIPKKGAVPPSPYLTHHVQAASDLLPEGLVLRRNAHLPETHGGKKAGSGSSTRQNPILSAQLLPRTQDGLSSPPSLGFTSPGHSFYPSCFPGNSNLALTQPWDRLQVQPEGREQRESGSICSLVFWQSARSGVDSGRQPAHTSCNTTCAVTKSKTILSKEGPAPRAPLGSPTTRAWAGLKPNKYFHHFLAPARCFFNDTIAPNHLTDPALVSDAVGSGCLPSGQGGVIFLVANTIPEC